MTIMGRGYRHLPAVTACLCLALLAPARAGAPVMTVARYTVSSRGFDIGDVVTTQRMTADGGESAVHFETRAAIRASFLWMGYRLSSTEKGDLLKGALVSYSHSGEENGVAFDVEGRLEDGAFRFDVRDHGTARTVVVPRSSYDYTTMECPEARLDFTETPRVTLRVLDVEKMAVVKREYHLVRTTHYAVAGKEYPCRVVEFTDPHKRARRWIAWDGKAVVLYRQDSRGEKSTYSVQATSVTREM